MDFLWLKWVDLFVDLYLSFYTCSFCTSMTQFCQLKFLNVVVCKCQLYVSIIFFQFFLAPVHMSIPVGSCNQHQISWVCLKVSFRLQEHLDPIIFSFFFSKTVNQLYYFNNLMQRTLYPSMHRSPVLRSEDQLGLHILLHLQFLVYVANQCAHSVDVGFTCLQ